MTTLRWLWSYWPFLVLAAAVPLQMLIREFLSPDRRFADEKLSRVFDAVVNHGEDMLFSVLSALRSQGIDETILKYIPFSSSSTRVLPSKSTRRFTEPLDMGQTEIRRAIHQHRFVLLNFYAPWCVHCKRFEPVYKKIAERLYKDESLDIVVGKVDGTKNRRIMNRHEIDAYPSVVLYADGDLDHPIQYLDVREPDQMIQWVNEEVEKLVLGEEKEEGYFAAPLKPKWRIGKVLFRVGDVVARSVNDGDEKKENKGVVLGWDYKAKAPREWLATKDAAEITEPHYMILWDSSSSGLVSEDENKSYVAQSTLHLVLDSDKLHVNNPAIDNHFTRNHVTGAYTPVFKLRILYPDD